MDSTSMGFDKPVIMSGGLAVDDRGEVSFVNDFGFQGVRRFYLVSNHRAGFIRAWHGHRKEGKYVTAVAGSAVVGAVKIDDWENPSRELPVDRFVLSAKRPSVLFIPPGYANGFMSLTNDLKLMFFSTSTLEESAGDDFRFGSRLWDPWQVAER
jgi:dTDP-4-dehydrorhamnose 3,5-epimerase